MVVSVAGHVIGRLPRDCSVRINQPRWIILATNYGKLSIILGYVSRLSLVFSQIKSPEVHVFIFPAPLISYVARYNMVKEHYQLQKKGRMLIRENDKRKNSMEEFVMDMMQVEPWPDGLSSNGGIVPYKICLLGFANGIPVSSLSQSSATDVGACAVAGLSCRDQA
ncbi:uncharacterized protein [Lolium perenne]|uniref:uncharacterized protein isoform X2 n=1 Tax=Lolium perenne TaxID=4522 RepID=UPI0021F5D1BC|nr:uncharacterized protein LOC127318556 isoform X2 [Lolium perenne]